MASLSAILASSTAWALSVSVLELPSDFNVPSMPAYFAAIIRAEPSVSASPASVINVSTLLVRSVA